MTHDTLLDVEDLTCIRGQRVLFRDLSFGLAPGRCLTVEGPNGAGKTSLLRTIAGFLPPASGRIVLSGLQNAEDRARRIGWLGHHDGAKAQLSPLETLSFFAGLYGVTPDLEATIHQVGLSRVARLPCQYLSAGQKKRLALARLQIGGHPLWLMDEPLAALDPSGKTLATSLIVQHCAVGGIAVVATHEQIGLDGETLTLGTS